MTNPDFETQAVYTFSVTATDVDGNTCLPFPVSLSVNDADDLERKWGLVRYIMIRGTDENGIYSNVGELDILDPDGNNLIDNGTLILDDFTYRYGGVSTQALRVNIYLTIVHLTAMPTIHFQWMKGKNGF